MLQIYHTAFREWMDDWFSTVNATDKAVPLRQRVQAYDRWMKKWLDCHSGSRPVPSIPASAITTTTTSLITAFTTVSSPATSISNTNHSPSFPLPDRSMKIAVYYGQQNADKISLGQICQNPAVDIVILAFLTHFFGPGGFPVVNFGAACGGQTSQMETVGGTGLLNCKFMAADIEKCQGLGKKVLLSMGGAREYSDTPIPNESKAKSLVMQLWDLFGAGTGVNPGLRPFGKAVVDGFDIGTFILLRSKPSSPNQHDQHNSDNEDHSTKNYNTFVSLLRQTMSADTSKKYYISAAPQCPIPDESIPLESMQAMDFVFVQWYNNPMCNAGTPAFLKSFKAWSTQLSKKSRGPKLYIGLPGCQNCAGSGYLSASKLKTTLADAKGANLTNFGGVMLWDGPQALANMEGGKDYLTQLREVL